MHAFAGIKYISLGGQERPLKFGTNQTAKMCEMRGIDLPEYGKLLANNIQDMAVIRDLLYSALWAGAKSEKKEIDFDTYDVGDMIDAAGVETVMDQLSEAMNGVANPNEKAQTKPMKASA